MWKIHRYYLRELSATVSLTLLVLFGIALAAFVYRGIDRARGGDLMSAVLITFYFAADAFPHLLAIALLLGTVFVFARAAQDREITALRAGGVSPRVPLVGALLVGVAFSLVGVWAQHYVIPSAHYHKYRVVADVARQLFASAGAGGDRIEFGDFVMFWRGRRAGGRFVDVIVKSGGLGSAPRAIERVFQAKEAWIEHEPGSERITMVFREPRDASGQYLERLSISVDVREVTERGWRTEGDKDLTSDQLLAEVLRGVHDNPGGAAYTVHQRACFALMPFLFAPLGFCIGVMARDRGRVTGLLASLLPLLVFYCGVLLSPQLARLLDMPSMAWLPAAAVALPGAPFCWRLLRV